MTDFEIKKPLKAGSPAGGEAGFILLETDRGPVNLRFAHDVSVNLILAIQQAQKAIHDERQKAGKTPIQTMVVKNVAQLEYGADVLNEVALIRTRFEDQSTQDLPIARKQIPDIVRFLNDALQQFEKQNQNNPQ